MNKFLISSLAIASMAHTFATAKVTDKIRPNIVLIMCDDMGFPIYPVMEEKFVRPTSIIWQDKEYVSVNLKIQDAVVPVGLLY